MQPSFTPAAQILWDAIPPHFQERILQNVWCPHCGDMTTMTDFTGEVHRRSLVLQQFQGSSRRNLLPVERIHGSLLMGHEHLACAVVELMQIRKTPSGANRVLHHAPKAFDGIEVVPTMSR